MIENYQYLKDYIFNEKEVITTDKYLNFAKNNNLSYIKTDFFATGRQLIWRGELHPIESMCKSKYLISGHSDYSIDEIIFKKYGLYFEKWFTINKNYKSEKLIALPLGITNYCDDTVIHKIYGDTEIMESTIKSVQNKNNVKLVYLNFNITTYPEERQLVYDLFSNKDYVTLGNIENNLNGRKKFLHELREHKFSLCPRGNGIDTHRLWESLYMGFY